MVAWRKGEGMNTDRAIVVVSLLWVGLLVVLSRSWLGDFKDYVRSATGHLVPPPPPVTVGPASQTPGGAGPGFKGT
jgi:hypothetical protein